MVMVSDSDDLERIVMVIVIMRMLKIVIVWMSIKRLSDNDSECGDGK